jgi:deaminated glutathione amidase
MKIALAQMTSGIDPAENAAWLCEAIDNAAGQGAAMLFTPEMSGLLDRDRKRAGPKLCAEAHDPFLADVCEGAAKCGIWVALGSLALAGERTDGRLVNRSLLIDNAGAIRARYDKMHLFDVDLPTGESWRESAAYAPGESGIVVETPVGKLGLSICYDIRFPALYAALSSAGAEILAVPAAFTVPTGKAHWHILLRARAIENAAWVIAAAQTGTHEDGRATYGHSLVIDPWGEVVLDMGAAPGLDFVEIPVLDHRRVIPHIVAI